MKPFVILFAVSLLAVSCHSAPTPVPVQEITTAVEVAQDAVEATQTVATAAGELSTAINNLAVPDEIKASAARLSELAHIAEQTVRTTQEKITAIQPIVETIAGERDQAISAEVKAQEDIKESRKTVFTLILVLILLLAGLGVFLVLRIKRLWLLFLYKKP